MHRSHVVFTGAGVALCAWNTPVALAQPQMPKRVGFLSLTPRESWPTPGKTGWQQAVDLLKQHDWVEGRNLQFEFRDAQTDAEGLDGAARQLVVAKVDLIMTLNDTFTRAALRATRTIPIVAISFGPVKIGLAQSLRRPGGNVTGVSFQAAEENGRVLALLRDIRPGLGRVGVPVDLREAGWRIWFEGSKNSGGCGSRKPTACFAEPIQPRHRSCRSRPGRPSSTRSSREP